MATITMEDFPQTHPTAGSLSLGDALIDAVVAEAQVRWDARVAGRPLGPVTGLRSLDEVLGGALAPGLHILLGSPGVGKTSFALQIATDCGCPALYLTTEMSAISLVQRVLARDSRIFLQRFGRGTIVADIIRHAGEKAKKGKLAKVAFLDATLSKQDETAIRVAAERLQMCHKPDAHLLIVIDSLHTWCDATKSDLPETDRLIAGINLLNGLSQQLSCPILAIAERNRATMQQGGLSAGAGTRKIEYASTTVLDLQKDEDDIDTYGMSVNVALSIWKNRSGGRTGKGIVQLTFEGAFQDWKDVTLRRADPDPASDVGGHTASGNSGPAAPSTPEEDSAEDLMFDDL